MKGKPKVQPFRRKKEGKTDYRLRLKLISSRKPRLVIRRTNQHITLQVVEFHPDGDKILAAASTSELKKYGWTTATKNVPAAYLAGLLCGMKAKKAGITNAIADLGLNKTQKGGVLYSALKGAVDGGITVPYGEGIEPTEDRLKGKHISENIESQFEKTKNNILKEKK